MARTSKKTTRRPRPAIRQLAASMLREEVKAAPTPEGREAAACACRVAFSAAEKMYEATFARVYSRVMAELSE